jgi:hypothetical protein
MRLSRRKFLKVLGGSLLLPGSALSQSRPAPPGNLRMSTGGKTTYVADTGDPVPNGQNLQAALDVAAGGDVIALQPGLTCRGNFTLPEKAGSSFITVTSDQALVKAPLQGVRVTPGDASSFAKIGSPNTGPALATAPRAHHWRIQLLEFLPTQPPEYDIIVLGSPGATSQSELAHDLVLDRIYVHGDPKLGQKRGIQLNSASTSILNSHISDLKRTDQDSQAICGWNGPGPYVIDNNYLEAAGENVLFGGADPIIPLLVPSDITIRQNHFAKPLSWWKNSPSFSGTEWQVKNLLELKNARRVTIEGNLFENNWPHAQTGYAILFQVRNQDGKAPWSTVEDVVFQRNVVRNVASVFAILGMDRTHPSGSQVLSRVTITQNLFYGVDKARLGGDGRLMIMTYGREIQLVNNTFLNNGEETCVIYGWGLPTERFQFVGNLVNFGTYGIAGESGAFRNFPAAVIEDNVFGGGSSTGYPPRNHFFSVSYFLAQFQNANSQDYRLRSDSPFQTLGIKGTPVGVDMDALEAALAGIK